MAACDRRLEALVTVARVSRSRCRDPLAVVFVRLGLYNRSTGVALWLAHAVLALPAAFLCCVPVGRAADIEDAARIAGKPLRAFLYVTLPLIRPQVATAALLVFCYRGRIRIRALLQSRTTCRRCVLLSALGSGTGERGAVVMLVPASNRHSPRPAFRSACLQRWSLSRGSSPRRAKTALYLGRTGRIASPDPGRGAFNRDVDRRRQDAKETSRRGRCRRRVTARQC